MAKQTDGGLSLCADAESPNQASAHFPTGQISMSQMFDAVLMQCNELSPGIISREHEASMRTPRL